MHAIKHPVFFPFNFSLVECSDFLKQRLLGKRKKKNGLVLFLSAFLYQNYGNYRHHSNEFDHSKCSNAKNERLLCCTIVQYMYSCSLFTVHFQICWQKKLKPKSRIVIAFNLHAMPFNTRLFFFLLLFISFIQNVNELFFRIFNYIIISIRLKLTSFIPIDWTCVQWIILYQFRIRLCHFAMCFTWICLFFPLGCYC